MIFSSHKEQHVIVARDEALKPVFEAATSKKEARGLNDEGGESRRAIRKKKANRDTDTNTHETYRHSTYGAYKYIIYPEH